MNAQEYSRISLKEDKKTITVHGFYGDNIYVFENDELIFFDEKLDQFCYNDDYNIYPFKSKWFDFDVKNIKAKSNIFGSKNKLKSNLFFIHNPKCAGSAIEQIAYINGIRWGSFCCQTLAHENETISAPIKYAREGNYLSSWHKKIEEYTTKELKDKETFTVVRNPYTKIISAFYWMFWKNVSNPWVIRDENEFNNALVGCINKKHLFPQKDFVYIENEKVTDHVLRLENLNAEFKNLMENKNLPLQINIKANESIKIFNVEDISRKNLDLINKRYEKDFELFGYEMI